jgi:hypothetical protein
MGDLLRFHLDDGASLAFLVLEGSRSSKVLDRMRPVTMTRVLFARL